MASPSWPLRSSRNSSPGLFDESVDAVVVLGPEMEPRWTTSAEALPPDAWRSARYVLTPVPVYDCTPAKVEIQRTDVFNLGLVEGRRTRSPRSFATVATEDGLERGAPRAAMATR